MQLNKITKLIVSFSAFSFLFLGSLSASSLIARSGHPAVHPQAQHAAHPATPMYHGNYNHPAINHGIENRAFNNGVEAGALEGAAVNGAGINGAVYGDGVVNPNPVYVVPNQPSVQYVTPTATQPQPPVAPVTVPQQ